MINRLMKILTVICLTLGTLLNGMAIRAEEPVTLTGKWFVANDKEPETVVMATGEISGFSVTDSSETGQWGFSNAIPTADGKATVLISKPQDNGTKPISFKVKEGSGTNSDPYQFELVYPATKETPVTSESSTDTESAYTVTITGGANAIVGGGETIQTGLTGAMTDVTFTANEGYHFEAYEGETFNGVIAALTDGVITVSGTPNANVEITIPDAVQNVQETEPVANFDGVNKTDVDTTIETNSLKKMTLKTANVDEGETQYNLWVGGTRVTSANAVDIFKNGTASYNTATNTVTLNGAEITTGHSKTVGSTNYVYGIYYDGDDPLNLELASGTTNSITINSSEISGVGIYSYDGLNICGNGNLTVSVSGNDSDGIFAIDWLTIAGANVSATATGDNSIGIYCQTSITISSGTVKASGNTGIGVATTNNNDININGGNVSAVSSGENGYAVFGRVKNSIAGTGWTNTAGTMGKADITSNTDGQILVEYKKVQFPAEYDLWVGGTQVTSENASNIPAADGGTKSGTASYDAEHNTLTLNNYSYTGPGYHYTGNRSAGINSSLETLTINLIGSNSITNNTSTDTNADSLRNSNNIEITGDGSLTCKRAQGTIAGYGIICDELTIDNATVVNVQVPNTNGGGVQADKATLNGGSLTTEGGWFGITKNSQGYDAILTLEINGGSLIASAAGNAINGTVKNSIAGTGWTNKEGTEGKTYIATSIDGQLLNKYKKAQFPAVAHTHDNITFQPWSSNNNLPASGNYYLTGNVTVSSTTTVSGTLNLCLNGYGILQTGNYRVYHIPEGSTMNLYDCNDSNSTHYVTLEDWRGTAVSETGTESTVTNGNGTVKVTGGFITGGNDTSDSGGGAVRVYGTFNMYGGTLLGNHAVHSGGAIWSSGTTTIADNSRILYNKGNESNRGGVYISSGTFNISGSPNLTGNSGCDIVLNGMTNISFTNFDKNVRLGKLYITTNMVRIFTSGANFKSDSEVQDAIQHFNPNQRAIVMTEYGQAKVSCIHYFTYATGTGENANTISATCNRDVCDLPDKKATLTIAKPLHIAYGDGKDPSAVITDTNNIKGAATIKYYKTNEAGTGKTGDELREAPTEPGTYWAEITLGTGDNTATAHVIYTIAEAYYAYQGDNQTWQKGSSDSLKFTFKGKYNDREGSSKSDSKTFENWLKTVTVDGKTIDKSSYNATEGSLIIDLKPAYLENLSVGDHKLSVSFEKAENVVTANFTVKAKSSGGGSSTPEKKTDNVVTCQMAGFPANYAWNEAAKACQPGYLDAGGNFHPYGTARRSNIPNTSDNGNLTFYTIAMFLMTFVAYITAKKLTEDSRA